MWLFNEAGRMKPSPLGSQEIKVNIKKILGCQSSYAEGSWSSSGSLCIPIHGISQHYLAVHMAFGYYYF